MKFELINEPDKFSWKLVTNNGDLICQSGHFFDKLKALESIQSVCKWSKDAPVIEVTKPNWQTEAIKALRAKVSG